MVPKRLNDEEIELALADLEGWARDGDHLVRRLAFADFSVAFGFMTSVAIAAERLHHHPEWSNVYNRVEIKLTTHDAGGLSSSDFELASVIDVLARNSEL